MEECLWLRNKSQFCTSEPGTEFESSQGIFLMENFISRGHFNFLKFAYDSQAVR